MGNIENQYEIMVTDVTNAQYARYLNDALAAGKVKLAGDAVVGYYPGDAFQRYNLRAWTHNSVRPDYASPSVGFRYAR